ncbi:cache domain-containing protein [candidate division KSB1 bacterium]|nr:cache domain-containing protein [candidate division KSB1 bacterium]
MLIPILKTISLRARIIITYSIILGTGGLLTSYVGSRITTSTILNQASSKVHHDMNTAKMVYEQQLFKIKQSVNLALFGRKIEAQISPDEKNTLIEHLEKIRLQNDLDFLTLVAPDGHTIVRTPNQRLTGDNVSWLPLVQIALKGETAATTEVLSKEALQLENPELVEQAHIKIIPTEQAMPSTKTEETSGMVLLGAAPVEFNAGRIGALYGGTLMNNNFKIVDRVWDIVYEGEKFDSQDIGTVTIFFNDLRISTNVKTEAGTRAVGTRVSNAVAEAVLKQGQRWVDEAFVVNDWYISEYEPIRNYNGDIIGILYVGQLRKAYTSIRDKVVLTFLGIASIGFFIIVAISYLITRTITKPLGEIVKATESITKGDLDHEVRVSWKDEIGKLALSFNIMVASLKKMRSELEEWANTLEQKVKERTEELVAMQKKVVQAQRLASVGKLAAGIAHEINNPLGGILVFSSLVLEDMPDDDPNRENIQEVINQTMRCRDIVKGLLQFSRQEQGKTDYVKVNDVLNITLSLIEKQALFHNIEVIREFDSDLPSILGDDSQLQQVFMNIILNAVQAMDEVGKLIIRTHHDSKHDMVNVEIEDTGCGIPPDLIDRIFDPFFTTKEVGKGTGLGLAIAYGIVTKHNGRMSVKSTVKKGTTFTIKIPAADNANNDKKQSGELIEAL